MEVRGEGSDHDNEEERFIDRGLQPMSVAPIVSSFQQHGDDGQSHTTQNSEILEGSARAFRELQTTRGGSTTAVALETSGVAQNSGVAGVSGKSLHGLALTQVDRIVKAVLPESMTLSKDARVALQKIATVTVLYLGAMAAAERDAPPQAALHNEEGRGIKQKKKPPVARSTLLPSDVVAAMEAAGWGDLVPQLSMMRSDGNNRVPSAAKRARE